MSLRTAAGECLCDLVSCLSPNYTAQNNGMNRLQCESSILTSIHNKDENQDFVRDDIPSDLEETLKEPEIGSKQWKKGNNRVFFVCVPNVFSLERTNVVNTLLFPTIGGVLRSKSSAVRATFLKVKKKNY